MFFLLELKTYSLESEDALCIDTSRLNWCNRTNTASTKTPKVSDVSTRIFKNAIVKYKMEKNSSIKLKKLITLSTKLKPTEDQFIKSFLIIVLLTSSIIN